MSNERNELAQTVATSLDRIFGNRELEPAQQDYKLADDLLAAGYRKPRIITTAEELDSLPEGSVTRDRTGDVQKRTYEGWVATGEEEPNYVALPATVIFEGEAA